jgi:hypothetical protein
VFTGTLRDNPLLARPMASEAEVLVLRDGDVVERRQAGALCKSGGCFRELLELQRASAAAKLLRPPDGGIWESPCQVENGLCLSPR